MSTNPPTPPLNESECARISDRLRYEDGLLNTRMGHILTLNGLAAVAIAMSLPDSGKLAIAGAVAFIDIIWILCAKEALRLLAGFKQLLRDNITLAPADDRLRYNYIPKKGRVSVNLYFGIIIPIILAIGWIISAGFYIYNLV